METSLDLIHGNVHGTLIHLFRRINTQPVREMAFTRSYPDALLKYRVNPQIRETRRYRVSFLITSAYVHALEIIRKVNEFVGRANSIIYRHCGTRSAHVNALFFAP